MMRTEEPRTIRLSKYRVPDWLVETVELDVKLHATQTPVRTALRLKPNPAAGSPAPFVLDGDGLTLTSLKLDGETLPANRYVATPDGLTIAQPPRRPFTLEIETAGRSVREHAAVRALSIERHLLLAMRGRRFPPHHLFPGPAGRDVRLHHPHRGGQSRNPGAARQRQPARAAICRAAGISRSGTIRGRSRRTCSRMVGGRLGCVEDRFITMSGREVALRIYVEPGKEDRCGYAMDSLKRAMRWDEQAFGREYDLDVFMIVAVSDFNMGAMENKGLNVFNDKYVLATSATATDADFANIEAIIAHEYFHNWTGNRITCRDWFQLCLKEGLTVFRDQEFTSDQRSRVGDPHRRRARAAHPSVRRRRRPARPSGPARAVPRDQQLLHRRPSTKRAPRWCACCTRCSVLRCSAKAWISISNATTARQRPSSSSSRCFADVSGRDLGAVHAVVFAGRDARGDGDRSTTTPRPSATASSSRRCCGRRRANPPNSRWSSRSPSGCSGATDATCRLTLADGALDRPRRADARPVERDLRVHRCHRAAGAVAQSRLLGAGQAGRQSLARRSAPDGGPRQRSVQPLAGGPDAGDPDCWSATSQGCARVKIRTPTMGCSMRSPQFLPTPVSSPPSSPRL